MRHKGLDRPRLPGGLGGSWLLQAGMQCAAECLHTLNWKMSCHTQIIWLTAWKLADSGSLDGWNTLYFVLRIKISIVHISNNRFSLPPLCPRFANMYLCWVSVRHPEHKIDCNAWVPGGRGGVPLDAGGDRAWVTLNQAPGCCPSIYDLLIETPYLLPRGAPALLPAAAGPGHVIAADKTVGVSTATLLWSGQPGRQPRCPDHETKLARTRGGEGCVICVIVGRGIRCPRRK